MSASSSCKAVAPHLGRGLCSLLCHRPPLLHNASPHPASPLCYLPGSHKWFSLWRQILNDSQCILFTKIGNYLHHLKIDSTPEVRIKAVISILCWRFLENSARGALLSILVVPARCIAGGHVPSAIQSWVLGVDTGSPGKREFLTDGWK